MYFPLGKFLVYVLVFKAVGYSTSQRVCFTDMILLRIGQLRHSIRLSLLSKGWHSRLPKTFRYCCDGSLTFSCWICSELSSNPTTTNDCPWKIGTYSPKKDGYLLLRFYRKLVWFISIKICPFYLSTRENTFRIIDPHSASRTTKAA